MQLYRVLCHRQFVWLLCLFFRLVNANYIHIFKRFCSNLKFQTLVIKFQHFVTASINVYIFASDNENEKKNVFFFLDVKYGMGN